MKKDIYILGVHSGHNATAALLKNGEIIGMVNEERFSGNKNHIGFPRQSVNWLLSFANISAKDIDLVVIPGGFGSPVYLSEETSKGISVSPLVKIYNVANQLRNIWGRVVYYYPDTRPVGTFFHQIATDTLGKYLLSKERQSVAQLLNISVGKIKSYPHHLSHAAAAYYSSPHSSKKTLVFTLDAEGDNLCASVSTFHKTKFRVLAETSREHSLGWVYFYVTRFLGMKSGEHEYKVMGLAPYAKEKDSHKLFLSINDIVTLNPANKLQFFAKFNTQDTYFYLKQKVLGQRFDNVAAAFQKLIEDRLVEWISYATSKTKITTIAAGGGVFMNVKANQKITQIPGVKESFFLPSCGDESLPLGACYLGFLDLTKRKITPKPLNNLYLGPEFSDSEISLYLKKAKLNKKFQITRPKNMAKKIAILLAKDKIVARVSGRVEWGARALGNRSIMANPSNYDLVKQINEQMKNRDFWMPFAPSILNTRSKDYLVNPHKLDAPFMILTFDSTRLAQKHLKAALHPYDLTLRPQIVRKKTNSSYFEIIREFEKLTGIGGVLNTSFNLHGYPICLGPKEAIYAFENSGLEYLALGKYLLSKN